MGTNPPLPGLALVPCPAPCRALRFGLGLQGGLSKAKSSPVGEHRYLPLRRIRYGASGCPV